MTKTFADLKAWILAQPDERPVDMSGRHNADLCGCLLIEYARDTKVAIGDCVAGMSAVYTPGSGANNLLQVSGNCFELIDRACKADPKTFADAKRILAEMEAP